jgi:uncharacterized protein YjbJ (UPF0337 family)
MNKNQVKGRVETAKGTIKQATGKVAGNKTLEQKGAVQKAGGKVQTAYGDARNKIERSTK